MSNEVIERLIFLGSGTSGIIMSVLVCLVGLVLFTAFFTYFIYPIDENSVKTFFTFFLIGIFALIIGLIINYHTEKNYLKEEKVIVNQIKQDFDTKNIEIKDRKDEVYEVEIDEEIYKIKLNKEKDALIIEKTNKKSINIDKQ